LHFATSKVWTLIPIFAIFPCQRFPEAQNRGNCVTGVAELAKPEAIAFRPRLRNEIANGRLMNI